MDYANVVLMTLDPTLKHFKYFQLTVDCNSHPAQIIYLLKYNTFIVLSGQGKGSDGNERLVSGYGLLWLSFNS